MIDSSLTGDVHPVALLFPMMSASELDELAADIEANGLLHPIVRDPAGVLLDGRNRLEACRRVRVDPSVTVFSGDPIPFILSANVNRRHMSKGQQAMATVEAKLYETIQLPYGWQSDMASVLSEKPEQRDLWRVSLTHAYAVHRYAPDLVPQVLNGGRLDQAYKVAVERKRKTEQAEQRRERDAAALTQLRKDFPDLAERVDSGTNTLAQALDAAEQLQRQRQEAEELRREIELALEEIGPESDIQVAEPDLSTSIALGSDGKVILPVPATGFGNDLRKATVFTKRVNAVVRELEQLSKEEPAKDAWAPELRLSGIRSAVSQIVSYAYLIAEKHNKVLTEPTLRRVI